MRYSYETIKKLAKQKKIRATDLITLAPQHDPFYAGMPADIINAKWFLDIWTKAGYISEIHLRRAHYWTVTKGAELGLKKPNGGAV